MAPTSLINRLSMQPRRIKQLIVIACDMASGLFAVWLAFSLRLETPHVPSGNQLWLYAAGATVFLPAFIRLGLYRAVFRYNGLATLRTLTLAIAIHAALFMAAFLVLSQPGTLPRSVVVTQPVIFWIMVFASRMIARTVFSESLTIAMPQRNLVIYGAGRTGMQAASSLAQGGEYVILGFVDDDLRKHKTTVDGLPVHAPAWIDELVALGRLDEVAIAFSGTLRQRRALVDELSAKGLKVTWLPGIGDIATGRVRLRDEFAVDVHDVLDRPRVQPDRALMRAALADKTVLVTGAGGSIGSEIARQVLDSGVQRLVLLDHSEFALYTINQEAAARASTLPLRPTVEPVLASVRFAERINEIVARIRPDVIFHAAAYKHVPIVEDHPVEGIETNTLGTLNVARAAVRNGVGRFVLISTDKAVRPTNVMGATKRMAEMIVQSFGRASTVPDADGTPLPRRTIFAAVRFGNVLDSSGSVLPLFRSQIAAGGPVTLTHPDVTRYFMTIPEAAQLVLQAGAMATHGEVYVLDMGSPVRIADLARRMIERTGHSVRDAANPDGDIEIRVTGLRPGEKLHEELVISSTMQSTVHPRISVALDPAPDADALVVSLEALDDPALTPRGRAAILKRLTDYRPEPGSG